MKMKVMKYAGRAAAIVYPLMAFIAYLFYPLAYGPRHNWLSDLGNSLVNPGAFFYNAGCVITAILLAVFYLGLNAWRTGDRVSGRLLLIAQASGIFSSLALILSAVFNIGAYPSLHSFFSMLIAIGMTWFLCFAGTVILRSLRSWKWIGIYGLAAAGVILAYGFFFNTPPGEWIAIGVFIVFICLLAFRDDQNICRC